MLLSVGCLLARLGIQVRPMGGDHRPRSIGPHQDQLQTPVAMNMAEDLESFPLKRMMPARNGHPRRNVLDVGSVS